MSSVHAIEQGILNGIVNARRSTLVQKAGIKALLESRKALIRFSDSLLKYRLDGSELSLPFSHELPICRMHFPGYSENIGRIARRVHEKYPNLTFVDVGANIGDTVAIVRSHAYFPILCIEGDPRYFSIMQQNVESCGWRDVYVAQVFVGSTSSVMQFRIENHAGSAKLVADANSQVRTERLADILLQHPQFSAPRMVKVDTDGFDCQILRSSMESFATVRPVVFFEYDPLLSAKHDDDSFAIFRCFLDAGYRTALFYDNNGDFHVAVDLRNRRLLEDLHSFYSRTQGAKYADVCVFHSRDSDLAVTVRSDEVGMKLPLEPIAKCNRLS